METIRLKHVKRYRADGKLYFYHRLTKERLPDDPAERAARVLQINATLDGWRDDTLPGSLGDLILRYQASPDFKDLAESTRGGYRTYLDLLAKHCSTTPVADIDAAWLYQARDEMADRPRAANFMLQVMSILMGFAIERGWRKDNPVRHVKKLRRTKSYEAWPDVAIERFRAEASDRMVWALELAIHTGQRQGDVLAMQWRHIEDGVISVAQRKTGARLRIRIHRDLTAVLDRIPREHMAIVHTRSGTPYTAFGFRSTFRAELKRIGLQGLQFHGLRHTAGRRLAEAGCTDREIMAILGHRTAEMVTRYTRGAEQERLADAAVVKLETRTRKPK